jgi:transcriptional regulator
MAKNKIDLLQGTLDMLILRTLQWGAQHGHGIAQAIRANSGELLQVETGSLYPALHRLEAKRWISAEWKVSAKNQRARYYRLTALGKKQLSREQSQWRLLVKAISKVLKPA